MKDKLMKFAVFMLMLVAGLAVLKFAKNKVPALEKLV